MSNYYITCTGKLCITFKSFNTRPPELCEVLGCKNETWFIHKEINSNESKID